MTAAAAPGDGPAVLVRRFYAARQANDPEMLRPFLAPEVDWVEPEVAGHLGRLSGAEAVLGMIRRAQEATGGTFRLEVVETVGTRSHCAAPVARLAERGGRALRRRELAVFGVARGRIVSARFHPENIADDRAFRGEAGQGT